MKRDMDLVRKIVFRLEESTSGFAPSELGVDGYTPDQVGYHCYLMLQAGLITGIDVTDESSVGPQVEPTGLTWAGYEFADATRSDTLWNKAKSTVAEKVGSVSIAVLTQYLQSLAKSALGL